MSQSIENAAVMEVENKKNLEPHGLTKRRSPFSSPDSTEAIQLRQLTM